MARRKKQRIFSILGAAVGTGLAVYGIRQGIRWYQNRQMDYHPDTYLPESSWPAERRYQPVDQPDRAPIPATGPLTAAPPMTGTTTSEPAEGEMTGELDDSGGISDSGAFTGTAQTFSAEGYIASQSPDIVMDNIAAPLIEHAIAFNSVMMLLRSRQRSGEGYEGTESLTAADRSSMEIVLDQMSEQEIEYDEASLRGHSLALRSYNLTRKLRDALDNQEYTGSDLFRIYGEVRPELCSLARDLEGSGEVSITGLDHIRQLYECE